MQDSFDRIGTEGWVNQCADFVTKLTEELGDGRLVLPFLADMLTISMCVLADEHESRREKIRMTEMFRETFLTHLDAMLEANGLTEAPKRAAG